MLQLAGHTYDRKNILRTTTTRSPRPVQKSCAGALCREGNAYLCLLFGRILLIER